MKHARVFTALAAIWMSATPLTLAAQDFGTGGFEIGIYGGVLNDGAPDFGGGDEEAPLADEPAFDVSSEFLVGGRLGYVLPSGIGIHGEIGYSFFPKELTLGEEFGGDASRTFDLNTLMYGGALSYHLQVASHFQLFIAGGAGMISWDPDELSGLESEDDFQYNYGGGAKVFLAPDIALRVDVRNHVMPDGLTNVRRQLNPGPPFEEDEQSSMLEISGGLSLFLGGPSDADGDDVYDERDRCPNTPAEAQVDEEGCPLDADGDGVGDYADTCPDTPQGARVNDEGCPTDEDGDGVPSGIDQCEGTPGGADVDETGCPSDPDGDGVPAGIDQCPGTPEGAAVDETGCPTDEDGDGVPSGADQCPGTPAGAAVDEQGCTQVEAGLERGRLVLDNIYFDFAQATLRAESKQVLNQVGEALLERPEFQIEVQGHTDAVGPEAYNQQLSQARAQSVVDYLLTSFPDLGDDTFTVSGLGESQPIASNDTEEGRQQNRRVEFVVTDRGEEGGGS